MQHLQSTRLASQRLVSRAANCGLVFCALLALALSACTVEEQGAAARDLPNDRVLRSAHFAYHARGTDNAICGDLLGTLERHFDHMQSMLGYAWPAGRVIHYYKFVDAADFVANAPCPQGSGGCEEDANVYAYDAFHEHELVHAYLRPFGRPATVLMEGAAVALACNRQISETPSLSLQGALAVRESLQDERVYDTGGRLVRYLLDRYGVAAFLRLYGMLGAQASVAELNQAMQAVVGASADDVWAAALTTHASCPPTFACSREILPNDGTAVSVSPVCGLPTDNRTFALHAGGDVAIAAPASTKVGSCDPIPFAQTLASANTGGSVQVGLLQLAAGRYYLDFPSAASDLAVLEPAQPWAGSDCSALRPFVVNQANYDRVAITIPRGISSWFTKVRFEGRQDLTLSRTSVALPSLKVLVCRTCEAASAACESVDVGDDPVNVSWQGDYVLRINALSPEYADRLQITSR